jgi:hypothetical protein
MMATDGRAREERTRSGGVVLGMPWDGAGAWLPERGFELLPEGGRSWTPLDSCLARAGWTREMVLQNLSAASLIQLPHGD